MNPSERKVRIAALTLAVLLVVNGCTLAPQRKPAFTTPVLSPTFPLPPAPSIRVIQPFPISLWAESEVGPVYAQETHYAKPSPDGRYLYVFSMDSRNILVLDLEEQTIVQEIKMPGFWAQAAEMIFSSDGRWMYTLSAGDAPVTYGGRYVVVIDTQTQQVNRLIRLPEDYEPGRTNIAISPDEQFLYICGSTGIYRADIESAQVVKVSNIGGISFLAFTPQGDDLLGANVVTNSLDIINPSDGNLSYSIPVGGSPVYIIVSPDAKKAYVSNWDSGDVSIVDLDMREVIATIPVGVNPLGMTITPDGYKLYVAVTAQALAQGEKDQYIFKVVVIDTKACIVIKEISPGRGAPRFLNISPDGTKVYVNEYIGRIHVIDTASDQLVDSILLTRPTTYLPDDIAVTPDGSKLFVYVRNLNKVLVIDTTTRASLAHFDVFSDAIAISSDGKRAYIPGFRFAVVDIPNLTVNYIDMPDIGGGNYGEFKIVLSNDERKAYIADAQRDLLQVVDLEDWRLIANIPVGNMGAPEFGLAITPDGNKIFISNGYSKDISVISTIENKVIDTIPMATPTGVDISPDGRVAYVIELNPPYPSRVTALDVTTHEVIKVFDDPVGFGGPWEVAISPDGQHAYFGGVDGEIVVVMDVESGATRYVNVGLDPFNLALTEDGRLLYASNTNSDDITVIDTQNETVVDRIPVQVQGMGFIYATVTDSYGNPVADDISVQFVPYDQGRQGNFESTGFALPNPRLDGYWIPVLEGDYMLFVSTNQTNLHVVNQVYDGISDCEGWAEAPRVHVGEGQITSVNFVLQKGHQVSGILVDQGGNPVSARGNIVDTQKGVNIGGCLGFGSGRDGHFSVVVPDGVYDLYFNEVLVASGVSVYEDVDLGRLTLSSF